MTRTNCLLCSSKHIEKIISYDHRHISKCKSCNHIFCSKYDEAELTNLYISNYYNSPTDPRINRWKESNKSIWQGNVSNITPYIKNNDHILDIGAGTGGFLQELYASNQTLKLSAIEISANAIESMRITQPYINIIQKELHDINENIQLDGITLLQVLEHVYDPLAHCRTILKHLKPGGFFLLTVPNRESIYVKKQGLQEPLCYKNPTHLQFFNKTDITNILSSSGFCNIKRLVCFGGGGKNCLMSIPQYILRLIGISSELRFLAQKPIS